jgi:hypothetical protein
VPGTMCAERLFDVGLDYQAVVRRLMYEIDLAPEQAIRAATAARSR